MGVWYDKNKSYTKEILTNSWLYRNFDRLNVWMVNLDLLLIMKLIAFMERMTLKELCMYFKAHNADNDSDSDACELYKNEYFNENIGRTDFEDIEEQDIEDLRPYLQCYILAIYEYLADCNRQHVAEWFYKYSEAYCPKEENDYYRELRKGYIFLHGNGTDIKKLDEIFDSMVSRSIEPFKSRGIAKSVFNDAV